MGIKVEYREIVRPLTEAIAYPTNGLGVIERGEALDILNIAGAELRKEIKDKIKENGGSFNVGEYFETTPHNLLRRGVKKIYHAVIIKYPGAMANLHCVSKLLRDILEQAIRDKIKSIAITGFGIDSGLERSSVANIMAIVCKDLCNKIDIKLIGKDEFFLKEVERLLQR